jgi:hypothetical protein
MEKKQYKRDSFIFKNFASLSLSCLNLLLDESVWYKYSVYFKMKFLLFLIAVSMN